MRERRVKSGVEHTKDKAMIVLRPAAILSVCRVHWLGPGLHWSQRHALGRKELDDGFGRLRNSNTALKGETFAV